MIVAECRKLAERVDALQLRERVMLLIAAIALVYFLVDSLGFQPVFEEHRSLLAEIEEKELGLDVLRARSSLVNGAFPSERSAPLASLRHELGIAGERLHSRLDGMLSPDRATSVLERVLTEHDGLVLNAVNTRRVPLGTTPGEGDDGAALADIDRYELDLRLEGGYLATLGYLRALEALPWKVFWRSVTFVTVDHPVARVDLDIYTLGRREH